MSRISQVVSISIITLAGLIPILYNIWLLLNHDVPHGLGFVYIGLGFLIILVGMYVFRLQQKRRQLNSAYSYLENEYKGLQKNYEALQAEYTTLQNGHQPRLPRICKFEDETAVPPLNSEQLYIMQQLFKGEHRIHIKPLEGGYNNFGVFHVIQETAENILLKPGVIVKYLSFRDILDEKKVYQVGGLLNEYPLAHIPGRSFRNWPLDHQLTDAEGGLGAVCYQLAMLDPDSQLQTLKNIYKQCSFQEIEPYLNLLFNRLNSWYARNLPPSEGRPLGGREGTYERLYRRRNDIQKKIYDLIRLSSAEAPMSSLYELDTARWIKLPFLPEQWTDKEFYNPIYWINNVLVPGQAKCFKATSRYSPIHGDLHTSNVLIETNKDIRLWLIDFPNAHIGPSLKDFATMEVDVKFNLIDMKQCSPDDWLKFEQQLLTALKDPFIGLNWPYSQKWQPEGELLKAWQFIKFLRSWVIEYHLIGNDTRSYYLALLHATLPVVYRDTHTNIQKQCALTSAAWMCEHLSS